MVPVDIVGKTGRTLTEVLATGRVVVDGVAYDAMTFRLPIPAGEPVEVTGWRLVGESSYVLSVRRPGDDSPAVPDRAEGGPAATTAEAAPPGRGGGSDPPHFAPLPPNWSPPQGRRTEDEHIGNALLTIGQILCVISGGVIGILTIIEFVNLAGSATAPGGPQAGGTGPQPGSARGFHLLNFLGGLCSLCFVAALFVTFGRVRDWPKSGTR